MINIDMTFIVSDSFIVSYSFADKDQCMQKLKKNDIINIFVYRKQVHRI